MGLRARRTAAAVAAAMIAVLGGCAAPGAVAPAPSGSSTPSTPSTPSSPSGARPAEPGGAEVAVGGPDCLADEVLTELQLGDASDSGSGRPAPRAGSVPDGFEPVRVVECRAGPGFPAESVPPEAPATVVEVVLTGDLTPLLAALSRASDPVRPGQACMAMYEFKPQIYLVDAMGRAVRPSWPVDSCGFLHDDARPALDGLSETGSTELAVGRATG